MRNLKVSAEGVEMIEQRDYGQGYFFASPMPAKECDVQLQNSQSLFAGHTR